MTHLILAGRTVSDPGLFDNFTWDHGATLLAAVLGTFITVGVAVLGYLSTQAASRRSQQAGVYAEALRAVEDYLEGPYRIRRRDGSTEQRSSITSTISDVKSRINFHQGLLRLHAPDAVADAYDAFVLAAEKDAGKQMSHAWAAKPTKRDREVPLGVAFERKNADAAKAVVVAEMRRSLRRRGSRR